MKIGDVPDTTLIDEMLQEQERKLAMQDAYIKQKKEEQEKIEEAYSKLQLQVCIFYHFIILSFHFISFHFIYFCYDL